MSKRGILTIEVTQPDLTPETRDQILAMLNGDGGAQFLRSMNTALGSRDLVTSIGAKGLTDTSLILEYRGCPDALSMCAYSFMNECLRASEIERRPPPSFVVNIEELPDLAVVPE